LNAADFNHGVGPKTETDFDACVGVHHAGVLPRTDRIVEILVSTELLPICVLPPKRFAAGITCPPAASCCPVFAQRAEG